MHFPHRRRPKNDCVVSWQSRPHDNRLEGREHSLVGDDFVAAQDAASELMCCIHKRNPTITGSLVGPFAEQVDQSLGEFAGYFDKALQLPSGFLKLLIRLQELPAVVLSEKMADSMKESDGRSSLTSKRVSRSRIESTRQQKYASHMESLPRPRRCSRDYKSCIPVSRNLFRTCSEEGPI